MRKRIKSINGFYELLKEINELKNPIFRGHSSISYELKSSSFRRLENKYKDINKVKRNISSYHEQLIEEFKSNNYHQSEKGKLSDLEILAKLQHYGAATCFLDFSKNIAVALWFACSSKEDKDGQLYIIKNIQDIINYKIVNTEQLKLPINIFYNDNIEEKENELVKHFLLWEPPYLSERILQQDSIFLFSKKEDKLDNKSYLHKVIIAQDIKKDILKILDSLFNMNKKTIYKDFHGFASSHAQSETIDFIEDGEKYFEIANQYFQADNYEKAIEYYEKSKQDMTKKTDLLDIYINLSYLYTNGEGKLEKALEYQKIVIEISENILEKNSPELAYIYRNISNIYIELNGEKNLQKSLEYQRKAIEIIESIDNNDSDLALFYSDMARIYQNLEGKDNLVKALEYQEKAIALYEKVCGEFHPSVGMCYNNYSSILRHLGGKDNLVKALEYQKKSIEISKKTLEKNNPGLATSYNNYSLLLHDLKGKDNLVKALEYQEKSIEIREKIYKNRNHSELASSYNNYATIFYSLGGKDNFIKSLEFLDKALNIMNVCFPNGHKYIDLILDSKNRINNDLNESA